MAYSETWAVRALTIIDYWSRGPKATFFFMCLDPFLHILKNVRVHNEKRFYDSNERGDEKGGGVLTQNCFESG